MNKNYNSLINQEIKDKFVRQNIYSCITDTTEYILSTTYDSIDNYENAPFNYDDIENIYNEEIEEYTEVAEWYQVSSFLCDKLKEKGQVVIPHMNYWGRCATGQAILLDSVISEICEDLEILEGQKYSWKK